MIDSELLRHVDFIKSQGIAVGRRVPLDLSEQETNGEALILAVEPCPSIEAGIGEVVTGTFSHVASEIVELRVLGQAEPIGVTPEHPFWSIERQDFVPVGELRIGETLRTVHGEQTAVESITPRGPPARVYNLEIDGAHQYHVSSLGLLVHNMCAKGAIPNPDGRKGNALTQAKTSETIENLKSRDFDDIDTEVKFKAGPLGSGSDRYADVVGRNSKTGEIEIIQIGSTLKSDVRVPVIRERRALDDIILSPDISSMKGAILRFVDVNRSGVIQP